MLRFLPLIVANGLRNRRRTALTVASLAVSLCLLSVLFSMYSALFLRPEASPTEALRLIVHHRVSITQPLPVSFAAKIRQIPGVRDAMVWQWFGGTYRDTRDPRNFFPRFAVEPDKLFRIRSQIELPEEEKAAFQRVRTACIVGRKLATAFQWKPGDRVTLVGDIYPVDLQLTIAGIYDDPEDTGSLFFHYEYLRERVKSTSPGSQVDAVGTFHVLADSVDAVPVVAAAIDREFENSPAPTKTETERAWQLSFISFVGDLKLFVLSISCALTFTVLMVSGNAISMSVRERVREVGILKTLGFTPGAILGIILGESAFIAVAAGVLGLWLAAAMCAVLRRSPTAFAALKLGVSPAVVVVVLLAAAAVGLMSAFVPARKAARTPILDSLRHAG